MDISKLIPWLVPQLHRWRNEVVMWCGLVTAAALFVQTNVEALEVTDLSSWQATIPAIAAYFWRMVNEGPESAYRRGLEAGASSR